MNLDLIAKKIMRKTKNWRVRDMRDDLRDYPEAHLSELKWIVRELKKVHGPRKACRK